MAPTKKRKGTGSEQTSPKKAKSNGTASTAKKQTPRKKQLTEAEKQEARDRAQHWADESKAAAMAAPPASRPPPSRRPPAAAAAATMTKEQKLQAARDRAAEWAAQELKSPSKKKGTSPKKPRTTVATPPVLDTNNDKKKKASSTTRKTNKTKTAAKKTSPVKAAAEKQKVVQEQEIENPKEEEPDEARTRGWEYKAKLVIALLVLIISFGLAVCTWCPTPLGPNVCAACGSVVAFFRGDETIKSMDVESGGATNTEHEKRINDSVPLETWQECRIFAAPTKIPGGGWGVFAARDFEEHEMVEVSSMFIPLEHGTPLIKNSALDDYIYGYRRDDPPTDMAAVSLGYIMMYNHGVSPNVKWMGFGREPDREHQNDARAVGFVTTRAIKAGEELLSSYGLEDGGEQWFASRGLKRQQISTEESQLTQEELQMAKQTHCPKLYAGYGQEGFKTRVLSATAPENTPVDPSDWLYPKQNAGFGKVIAKVPLKPGDVVESGPALAMHVDYVVGTALAPLVFAWNVLGASHRINLRLLREAGELIIAHQSVDTNWKRVDQWDGYEKLVILPACGSISMVERVGHKDETANCRIEITGSGSDEGSASLMLRLVATRNVGTGEALRLAVNPSGTSAELVELRNQMQRTGQPLFWIRNHQYSGGN